MSSGLLLLSGWSFPLLVDSSGLPLHIPNQQVSGRGIEMEVGHAHVLILLEQGVGQWITLVQQRLRNLDDFLEPLGIADLGKTAQVRPDRFPSPNGMAGRALSEE